MTNLVFIHGVNYQQTGYSDRFFNNIIKFYKSALVKKGKTRKEARERASKLIQKEILWADVTTNLANRYTNLQYVLKQKHGWSIPKRKIDPLAIQIMHYVRDKGHNRKGPMHILKRVHDEFKKSCVNKPDKIIIIAHSLGSVIAFDYLFGFRKYKLSLKVKIDALITLGSPVPLFIASMGFPESKITLPKNIRRWINIIDPDDGIARFCKPHFKKIKVKDIVVNTGWNPINAHTKYFSSKKVARIIAGELIKIKLN